MILEFSPFFNPGRKTLRSCIRTVFPSTTLFPEHLDRLRILLKVMTFSLRSTQSQVRPIASDHRQPTARRNSKKSSRFSDSEIRISSLSRFNSSKEPLLFIIRIYCLELFSHIELNPFGTARKLFVRIITETECRLNCLSPSVNR